MKKCIRSKPFGQGVIAFILLIFFVTGPERVISQQLPGHNKNSEPVREYCPLDGGPCVTGPEKDPHPGSFAEQVRQLQGKIRKEGSSRVNPVQDPPLPIPDSEKPKLYDLEKEPWFVERSNMPTNHPSLSREKMVWARELLWTDLPSVLSEIPIEKWLTPLPNDRAGKYILIEAWATWCPPCRRSLPYLNWIQKKYKDELIVIAICETDEAAIRAMPGTFRPEEASFTVGIDTGRRFANALGVYGIPHAVLLEPMFGGVVWEGMPTLPGHELTDKKLEKILAIGKRLKELGKLPAESPIRFLRKDATEEERASRRLSQSATGEVRLKGKQDQNTEE